MSSTRNSLAGLKCVITPNARVLRATRVRLTVPAGTHAIECFEFDARGHRRVYATHLPGGIAVKGRLKNGATFHRV